MQIGIIGAGNIGATLAQLLVDAGYDVAISNSRGPETLAQLVQELGPRARAATIADAARFGEVVIEAIPFGRYLDLPAEALAGKILVTAANYYAGRDGAIDLGGKAQSELVAAHLPQSRVVKAFNTIYFQHLRQQGDTGKPLEQRRVIPVSGDDPAALETVAAIISAIGFGPLVIGTLAESTRQEPDAPIYNTSMTVADARALLGA